jgi:hypothetical protein
VERKAKVMTAAVDLIDDVDTARRTVEPNRATVMHGRLERQVTVVLSGPRGGPAVVRDLDLPAVRVTQPQEGPAVAGLVLPAELDRVVRDGGPKI